MDNGTRQVFPAVARNAHEAARAIAKASTDTRNSAVVAIAEEIDNSRDRLLSANSKDLDNAIANQIDQPLVDRLKLTPHLIDQMCSSSRAVAQLPDPIGSIRDTTTQPSGIQVGQMRIPLGVIGMIYESRPNVTNEAAALCIKSGNACILRGGSEAIYSNTVIADCIEAGLARVGLPRTVVQVIRHTDRTAVGDLLSSDEYVDLIVPRGGKSLIERVLAETKIPVLQHLDGICHVYIDNYANEADAIKIAVNSKCSKVAVCNALETLLIHREIAPSVLPNLVHQLHDQEIDVRGCNESREICRDLSPADEDDWSTEYLAPILSVKLVGNINEAIDHISQYGSGHTDAIVSQNYDNIQKFFTEVDSASVIANASTQFADGFEYGLGAEIGISTAKLHARGPVGLEGLTTQKFVVMGHGELRQR